MAEDINFPKATATIKYYCLTDSVSLAYTYLPFTIVGSKPLTVPASICSGSSGVVTTKVLTYAQNILNGTTGVWSVQNTLRGTIDQNGLLTVVTPGGHPIVIYTLTNKLGCARNLYDTSLTIYALPVSAVISGPTSVCTSNTIQLSANSTGTSNVWSVVNPTTLQGVLLLVVVC